MFLDDVSIGLYFLISDYCDELKGFHWDTRIQVCFLLSHTIVREAKLEEASAIMKERIIKENDFKMWTTNKSKSMYLFQHWKNVDEEQYVDEIKRTLVEVLQAVKERGTKFVIIFPLSIWGKYSIIQKLGDIPCVKKLF
jgi:hypothetical protein